MLQIITPEGAHFIGDTDSVKVEGNSVIFNVKTDKISITGSLVLGTFNPLKSKVMGPFSYLLLECKHDIYSMKHALNGKLVINGIEHIYSDSLGYIEGDSGKNFPKKYIWYNSVTDECTVTMAIATIPLLGFIKFKGLLCFIKTEEKEYKICTYNLGKIKIISDGKIVLKKGKYVFSMEFDISEGHNLKAPVKGNMDRYIKEAVTTKTSYKLQYKNDMVIEVEDVISSLEYMWN